MKLETKYVERGAEKKKEERNNNYGGIPNSSLVSRWTQRRMCFATAHSLDDSGKNLKLQESSIQSQAKQEHLEGLLQARLQCAPLLFKLVDNRHGVAHGKIQKADKYFYYYQTSVLKDSSKKKKPNQDQEPV